MSQYYPMSQTGYNKLKSELEHLQNEVLPDVTDKMAAARDEGDLKENAEYHAQRERQGQVQAKINLLRTKLQNATIVDPGSIPKDEVAFGSTVVVRDLDYDDEEEFTFVGSGEEDYDAGKYLITSPIGQGLLGKKVGEHVEIDVPKGKMRFEVLEIRPMEME